MSNHYYFKNNVAVNDVGNFSKAKTITIRNTLEKLPKYLKKVSRKYESVKIASFATYVV